MLLSIRKIFSLRFIYQLEAVQKGWLNYKKKHSQSIQFTNSREKFIAIIKTKKNNKESIIFIELIKKNHLHEYNFAQDVI